MMDQMLIDQALKDEAVKTADGSGQGHPGHRERDREDSLGHGERRRFAGAGRSASWRAGRRMFGLELQHPLRYAAARARPCISVRRCAGFCRSEVVHLSARNDARLSGDPDAARIRLRESELDQVLRLREFVLVVELEMERRGVAQAPSSRRVAKDLNGRATRSPRTFVRQIMALESKSSLIIPGHGAKRPPQVAGRAAPCAPCIFAARAAKCSRQCRWIISHSSDFPGSWTSTRRAGERVLCAEPPAASRLFARPNPRNGPGAWNKARC